MLFRGDCLDVLATLPAGSVQLVVTSPPYNVGWRYHDDGTGDRRPLPDYLALLSGFLDGCRHVLREGGVLAVNLPPTIRTPEHRAYPLAAVCQTRLLDTGWLLREPLCWVKGKEDCEPIAQSTAFGAATNPYLRPVHEYVILASKGDYRMPGKAGWPAGGESCLPWLKDVWHLPAGRAKAGEPLAFPSELVRRLVLLYSGPADVVLDPFAGTGTVGGVARMLGRVAWLIEREPAFWDRLEGVIGQGLLFDAPAGDPIASPAAGVGGAE
jgi:DNA modification methylase